MAIDPVTGMETEPAPQGALAGIQATATEPAPDDTLTGGSGGTGGDVISEVQIPDVGLGEARETIGERTEEEQQKMKDLADEQILSQPEYVAPPEEALDTIEGADIYQRPEDMVSWQMEQLLNQDSPYMQIARQRAEEQAQRFGLLGSSMSVGASHRAAIESALPIAQQDAQTSAKFSLQQQAAENQIGTIEAETELGSALMMQRMALEKQAQVLDQSFKLAAQGLDFESQTILADIQGRWQLVTNDANLRLEAALKEKLNNQQIDAETVASVRAASADLVQNYQISVEELLKDPDFLQLGSATIQQTLNNMLATTTASIQFMADSSGINLDDFLDDFDANAAFTADVEAPAP